MTALLESNFATQLRESKRTGSVVVQPRMGFADPATMRAGLLAVRAANALTVGTITVDSYTRVGDIAAADAAVRSHTDLNGYPLCSHSDQTTRSMLADVRGPGFPVQVRHGSARPGHIITRLIRLGLDATEGGPVSYCLPYGRTPLRTAVDEWSRACDQLAAAAQPGQPTHMECFGGCLLGQLCPPSLLVAISVLEGLFFRQHGVPSVSLSYAQQSNPSQDLEALNALQRLIRELMSDLDTHIVLYTYMGVFPRTRHGALALIEESARLAVHGGARRLIVKTANESRRIPSIADNVEALEHADRAAHHAQVEQSTGRQPWLREDSGLYQEAGQIVDAVRSLHPDLGRAILLAFQRGILDVPYCLHPDTLGKTCSRIDTAGRLEWTQIGSMPINGPCDSEAISAVEFNQMLRYVADRFDGNNHGASR